jgi:hypothetical protein
MCGESCSYALVCCLLSIEQRSSGRDEAFSCCLKCLGCYSTPLGWSGGVRKHHRRAEGGRRSRRTVSGSFRLEPETPDKCLCQEYAPDWYPRGTRELLSLPRPFEVPTRPGTGGLDTNVTSDQHPNKRKPRESGTRNLRDSEHGTTRLVRNVLKMFSLKLRSFVFEITFLAFIFA